MMVKIVNDNVHPYNERFKGQQIHIPPKGFIEMDFNEASQFLGTMPPNIEVDASGIQKPTSYKMLRIEKPGDMPKVQVQKYLCMSCNKDLQTKAAYEAHVETEHLSQMVDDEEREKIETKRKPGRPKGIKHDAINDRDSGKA